MLNIDTCCFHDINNLTSYDVALMNSLDVIDTKLLKTNKNLKSAALFGITDNEDCSIQTLFNIVMLYGYIDILHRRVELDKKGQEEDVITDYDSIAERIHDKCNDYYQEFFSELNIDMEKFILPF